MQQGLNQFYQNEIKVEQLNYKQLNEELARLKCRCVALEIENKALKAKKDGE